MKFCLFENFAYQLYKINNYHLLFGLIKRDRVLFCFVITGPLLKAGITGRLWKTQRCFDFIRRFASHCAQHDVNRHIERNET